MRGETVAEPEWWRLKTVASVRSRCRAWDFKQALDAVFRLRCICRVVPDGSAARVCEEVGVASRGARAPDIHAESALGNTAWLATITTDASLGHSDLAGRTLLPALRRRRKKVRRTRPCLFDRACRIDCTAREELLPGAGLSHALRGWCGVDRNASPSAHGNVGEAGDGYAFDHRWVDCCSTGNANSARGLRGEVLSFLECQYFTA